MKNDNGNWGGWSKGELQLSDAFYLASVIGVEPIARAVCTPEYGSQYFGWH
jgi:hypothetical protein